MNILPLIEVLIIWMIAAAIVLRWARYSSDSYAGERVFWLRFVVFGLLFMPLGKAFLPEWSLPVLPSTWVSLSAVSISGGMAGVAFCLLAAYLVYVISRLWMLRECFLSIRCLNRVTTEAPPKYSKHLASLANTLGVATPKLVFLDLAHTHSQVPLLTPTCSDKPSNSVPCTYGWRSPVIVLPKTARFWNQERLERVLVHELMHIQQRDWLWSRILEIGLACLPFLPVLPRIKERIEWFSEIHADDAVLAYSPDRSAYASDMLAITTSHITPSHQSHLMVTSLFDGTYAYERIAAVLDGSRARGPVVWRKSSLRGVGVAAIFWALASTISLASVPPKRSSPVWGVPLMSYSAASSHTESMSVSGINSPSELYGIQLIGLQVPFEQPVTHRVAVNHTVSMEGLSTNALFEEVKQGISVAFKPNFSDVKPLPIVEVKGYVASKSVMPIYPRNAERKKIEGKVIAQFDILPSGEAANIRIAMASPEQIFEESVIKAVSRSSFIPATLNGKPITTEHATQVFTFRLNELTEGANHKIQQPKSDLLIKTALNEKQ